jgi:membrane protein
VLALLSNVEENFNHIWGAKETRPLFRRFSDYFSVLVLGPLFLLLAISMTTTLESHGFVQTLLEQAFVGEIIYLLFRLLPYVMMWLVFFFLYIFMPNVRVNYRAALVGGILGGTLWQLAQWGYVTFQFGVSRYNAIYGTMAALPILMVWIYISWLIVLFGVEVTYAWQNQNTIRREIREGKVNYLSQEMAALSILVVVTRIFCRGERPWDLEQIADSLKLPPKLSRKMVEILVQLGFLSEVRLDGGEESAYQPARSPERTTVYEVWRSLREDGVTIKSQTVPEWEMIQHLEEKFEAAEKQALGGMTLQELAMREGVPTGHSGPAC